jgi:hypothetical protein
LRDMSIRFHNGSIRFQQLVFASPT